jgi:protein-tyrosine phosphatase
MSMTGPALYDVHTHVLNDIDDGATNPDMTLAMLRLSVANGVTSIVATPHSEPVTEAGGPSVLHERLDAVRALAAEHHIPVELLPGMEVHLTPDIPEGLASGKYITLNGTRYVLVEFDFIQWAAYTDEVLFEVAVQSLTPLLAHVERIGPIQDHPKYVIDMVERGYYSQVTAASLLGGFGSEARACAETLLSHSAVHVIASDTHRPAGTRGPMPQEILKKLTALAGEEAAHELLYENPARVVRGEPLHTVEPRKPKRWWRLGL